MNQQAHPEEATFICDSCETITPAMHSLNLSSEELLSQCPKCKARDALFNAALVDLEEAQERLIRQWVTFWNTAGLGVPELVLSDLENVSKNAARETLKAIKEAHGL